MNTLPQTTRTLLRAVRGDRSGRLCGLGGDGSWHEQIIRVLGALVRDCAQ